MEYKVVIDEATRDLVQRKFVEYYHKNQTVKGLIEDHAYDKDPNEFYNSPGFQFYEDTKMRALVEYETIADQMQKSFLPKEFQGIENYKWELDYDTCTITYTKA